ncbi:MAG: dTDP-4-dehydrorhamnose reductase [Chlamydiae bacterium]|nr:dTDP-4-dehydrorhamnose reductase [Chlamydiota bacterium]
MTDEKIIIIGCSGYVGSQLFQFYNSRDAETLGTSRHDSKKHPYFDLNNPSLDFLDQLSAKYTTAIICAAIPNIAKCENAPKETFSQNVLGTLNLAQQLVKRNIKPVFFSSDVVFDGKADLYQDESAANPINEYGSQKLLLEQLVPKICDDYLMIRLSKTFSVERQDETFLHQLAKQVYSGKSIRAASDLVFNPINISDVIKAIDLLIQNNCNGTYNISGTETTSWYLLANQLADAIGLSKNKIEETSIDEFGKGASRAKKLNVQPKKLLSEFPHFKFSTINENIQTLKKFYPSTTRILQ